MRDPCGEPRGYVLRNRAGEVIQCGDMQAEQAGEGWSEWRFTPSVTLRDGDTLSMRWGASVPTEEWE